MLLEVRQKLPRTVIPCSTLLVLSTVRRLSFSPRHSSQHLLLFTRCIGTLTALPALPALFGIFASDVGTHFASVATFGTEASRQSIWHWLVRLMSCCPSPWTALDLAAEARRCD